MAYEMNDNSGSLFPNRDRKTDNHPNVTGQALIDGVQYWVSAWTKTDKNGNKWQSLSFKKKEERAAEVRNQYADQSGANQPDFDDDLPF